MVYGLSHKSKLAVPITLSFLLTSNTKSIVKSNKEKKLSIREMFTMESNACNLVTAVSAFKAQ